MKTLDQFKREERIDKIDLLQGKGRMYATVNEKKLIVATSTDLAKPLYVIPITEDKDKNPVSNVFAIINSATVKTVASC